MNNKTESILVPLLQEQMERDLNKFGYRYNVSVDRSTLQGAIFEFYNMENHLQALNDRNSNSKRLTHILRAILLDNKMDRNKTCKDVLEVLMEVVKES